jgi:hypothetical protein
MNRHASYKYEKTFCSTEHPYFFQVLTGCEAAWVPAASGQLPDGALPSGETEDGEPLFVGRASHEGTLTVGKVRIFCWIVGLLCARTHRCTELLDFTLLYN